MMEKNTKIFQEKQEAIIQLYNSSIEETNRMLERGIKNIDFLGNLAKLYIVTGYVNVFKRQGEVGKNNLKEKLAELLESYSLEIVDIKEETRFYRINLQKVTPQKNDKLFREKNAEKLADKFLLSTPSIGKDSSTQLLEYRKRKAFDYAGLGDKKLKKSAIEKKSLSTGQLLIKPENNFHSWWRNHIRIHTVHTNYVNSLSDLKVILREAENYLFETDKNNGLTYNFSLSYTVSDLIDTTEDQSLKGKYDPNEKIISILINRSFDSVCATGAHELMHAYFHQNNTFFSVNLPRSTYRYLEEGLCELAGFLFLKERIKKVLNTEESEDEIINNLLDKYKQNFCGAKKAYDALHRFSPSSMNTFRRLIEGTVNALNGLTILKKGHQKITFEILFGNHFEKLAKYCPSLSGGNILNENPKQKYGVYNHN